MKTRFDHETIYIVIVLFVLLPVAVTSYMADNTVGLMSSLFAGYLTAYVMLIHRDITNTNKRR